MAEKNGAPEQASSQSSGTTMALEPTTERVMGKTSYFFAWMGGCVSIGTFTVGSSYVGKLNPVQLGIAMAIGCFVIGFALMLNGAAGYKYGIPFVIQARSSFGARGTILAGAVRAIPALVWYGFQSWIGAGALNKVSDTIFGFDNLVFYFIVFLALQTALSVFGFKGIKWLENVGAIFIICSLLYMFVSVIRRYGDEIGEAMNNSGTWGLPFWNATMLFLGIYATMILNVSDYSREHTKGTGRSLLTTIYAMSILPVTIFMGLIGLMVSEATGKVDPIDVFANAVDNTPLLIITLLFIAFAQVTTNVLNNVVPPVYVLMDMFKIPYRVCVALVGVLSVATFPWLLVRDDNADGLQLFIEIYSAFLGPIFAIMVVDYYIIRKQELDIDELYDTHGRFRWVNWNAYIATAVGVVVAFTFSDVAWYASLVPAGLTYWLLMTYAPWLKRFGAQKEVA
ncbi:MAG: NCS1 family transporter [Actinomycetaceae bacterium]|nr:NCS1 family transporter [Actinomycetaceae bacterium]